MVLAGDFNVSPDTQTISNIEKYLLNIFKDQLKFTFNLKIKKEAIRQRTYIYSGDDLKGFANAAVDMIFVSPGFKVVDHCQPKVDASDHYPLVAVLEI